MVVLGRSAFLKKSLAKTDLVDPACSGHSPREKKVGKEKRDNKVLRCRTLDLKKYCLGKVLRGGCRRSGFVALRRDKARNLNRRQAEQNCLSPAGHKPGDWRSGVDPPGGCSARQGRSQIKAAARAWT